MLRHLKEARKRAKMTQAQVAEVTGIALGTLRRWEQGVNEPDIAAIILLADLYGTTTDDLLGSKFAGCQKLSSDPVLTDIISLYQQMNSSSRGTLHDLAASLVEHQTQTN